MGDLRGELVARFIAADQLYQRRCFEPALRGFQGCLAFAARQQLKLEFEQLVDLLMWIGRCHLALRQVAQALRYFHALEQLYTQLLEIGDLPTELRAAARKIDLRSQIGELVPPNLVFGLKLITGLNGLLGGVYESLAATYQQADQLARAEDYYQKAIALRHADGDAATIAKLYMRLAMAQMRRAHWDDAQHLLQLAYDEATAARDLPRQQAILQLRDHLHVIRTGQTEGTIKTIDMAGEILARFAEKHCGRPRKVSVATKKPFLGVFGGEKYETNTWTVDIDLTTILRKDADGNAVVIPDVEGALLSFAQQPEAAIRVTLQLPQTVIDVLKEEQVAAHGRPVVTLIAVHSVTVQASPDTLTEALEGLLNTSLVRKQKDRLIIQT